ncbi:trypsin-like [Calliphora vicina]|uniref:trypsin-like n=1 Tax=Calliphora vicina TaxID=7373 RepID=UPI00325BD24D
MLRFVTIFTLVSCGLFTGTTADILDGRIVNGVDTTIQAYPYQVSLQTNDGFHFCGGSIISEDIIVTAAHCMQSYKASQFKVRLGSTEYNNGGELVAVKAFKYHEGYNPTTMVNDVAVIKMATPVRESSKIRYIKLAEKAPSTGTTAAVTGWGSKCFLLCITAPKILQVVEVDIVDQQQCASSEYNYGDKIKETMLCAYAVKKDACQGDSGGPLVANNVLVGIVSWGNGCAWAGYPGVYCDVASVRSWIEKTAKEL